MCPWPWRCCSSFPYHGCCWAAVCRFFPAWLLVGREEPRHGSDLLWEDARSFLRAWQSQSSAGSENRHAAKPIREVGNASVMTDLRRKLKPRAVLPRGAEALLAAVWPARQCSLRAVPVCVAALSQPRCGHKGRGSGFSFSAPRSGRAVEWLCCHGGWRCPHGAGGAAWLVAGPWQATPRRGARTKSAFQRCGTL